MLPAVVRFGGHTGVGQRVGKIGFQRQFAVAGQLVELIGRGAADLGQGACQGVFGFKGVLLAAAGVVVLNVQLVHIVVAHHTVVIAAAQNDRAGGRAVVLLGKGRVQHWVALLPAEVAALVGIAVQQAGDVGILLPGLGQVVGGDIAVQLVQKIFRCIA